MNKERTRAQSMENTAGWRPQGSPPVPQKEDWDLTGIALLPLLSLVLPRPHKAYSSPAESWLYFHVQNASAMCDCTFPHHLQPAHILLWWNDGIQHSLDQTWQNRVAKWWHSCLQVKIIHWNVLKCWYKCSWHCSVPAGEGGSRCPAKSFGHHKRKRRTGWFSSCHPRHCPSSFLSCLPDTLEITSVISPGQKQTLTQAAAHRWHLLGWTQGISKPSLGPSLTPKGSGTCGVGDLCPSIYLCLMQTKPPEGFFQDAVWKGG